MMSPRFEPEAVSWQELSTLTLPFAIQLACLTNYFRWDTWYPEQAVEVS